MQRRLPRGVYRQQRVALPVKLLQGLEIANFRCFKNALACSLQQARAEGVHLWAQSEEPVTRAKNKNYKLTVKYDISQDFFTFAEFEFIYVAKLHTVRVYNIMDEQKF